LGYERVQADERDRQVSSNTNGGRRLREMRFGVNRAGLEWVFAQNSHGFSKRWSRVADFDSDSSRTVATEWVGDSEAKNGGRTVADAPAPLALAYFLFVSRLIRSCSVVLGCFLA